MNQNLYNVDKKTTDKGWKAMREILDREMPVEQPRRRVWLLWLLALLLPAAGFFFWPKSKSAQPIAPVSTSERPVAERQAKPNRDSDNAALVLPNATSEEQIATNTPPSVGMTISHPDTDTGQRLSARKAPAALQGPRERFSGRIAEPTVAPGSIARVGEDAATEDFGNLKNFQNPNTPDNATPETATATSPLPHSTETAPPDLTSAPQTDPIASIGDASATEPDTPKLANRPAALEQESPEHPPSTVNQPPSTVNRSPSIAWAATTGLLAKSSALLGGMSLGLTADARLGKRWGLRTGLAYQYHRLQGEDRPIVTVTSGAYADATGDQSILTSGGFTVNALDLTAPVYVPVSRLHRLEVPLTAFWMATSNLRLYGGVSAGLNIWAQTGTRALKGGNIYEIKDGVPARNLNQKVSTQLRNLQVGLTLGAGYRLHQRLEVGLALYSPIRALSSGNDQFEFLMPNSMPGSKYSDGLAEQLSARREAALGRPLLHLSGTVFF